jgi:hypothetical protein
MKHVIVVILGFTVICVYGCADTAQLKSFTEILNALKSGEQVRGIFYYKECRLTIDGKEIEKVPEAIGGMDLNTFEYFVPGSIGNEKGYIASSHAMLIHHPRYGYVLNYVKVKIYEDDTVKIGAQYVTPNTFEMKMDEIFTTDIHNGTYKGGARFYMIK